MLNYFIKGAVLGFYIAAPFGVISVLYIRRTLKNGALSGIISALGVTTAETFYASAAIYGLSFISNFLLAWKDEMKLCGAFFLLTIGVKSFFSNPKTKIKLAKKQSLFADYSSMFFLSILNPIAIVGFVAIFGSFGAGNFQSGWQALVMLLGFAAASFLYCLVLITIATILRVKFNTKDAEMVEVLNHMSGVIIILFTIAIFTFSFLK